MYNFCTLPKSSDHYKLHFLALQQFCWIRSARHQMDLVLILNYEYVPFFTTFCNQTVVLNFGCQYCSLFDTIPKRFGIDLGTIQKKIRIVELLNYLTPKPHLLELYL